MDARNLHPFGQLDQASRNTSWVLVGMVTLGHRQEGTTAWDFVPFVKSEGSNFERFSFGDLEPILFNIAFPSTHSRNPQLLQQFGNFTIQWKHGRYYSSLIITVCATRI